MDVGVRVIRGPSWNWDDQDGSFVGTVVKPFESSANAVQNGTVFVQWDNGLIGNYRVGKDGDYDLRILDSGPAGIKFPGISCDECSQKDIIGTRWKCAVCSNYDLCHACYHNDKHNLMHHFVRYDSVSAKGIEVPSRANSEKSEVHGIFPGATVVRRVEDWLHGQNDGGMGGMPGAVLEDPPPRQLNSNHGSVMVLWENGDTVEHSCGNDGKVALKCVTAEVGKEYYVQHLADLVADQFIVRVDKLMLYREEENQSPPPEASGVIRPFDPSQSIDKGIESFVLIPFRPGERVQVNMDVSVFRALQDDHHGGWNPEMELCIGATGVVLQVSPRIIVVLFKGLKKKWAINPEALTKKLFDVGDQVKILPDEQRVQSFQKGHGGWVHKMKEDLGKVAEVVGTSNGRVLVKVGSRPYRWTLNANCCTLVECNPETGFRGSSDSDDDSESGGSSQFMEALLSHHLDVVRPELLVQFSAKNKVPLVKAIVEKYPHQINIKNQGKTALHLSCLKGHVATVRVLLDAGADITVTDEEGNTPVHYSVHRIANYSQIAGRVNFEVGPRDVPVHCTGASNYIGMGRSFQTLLEESKDDPRVLEVILERSAANGDHVNFKLISVLQMAVHKQHPRCVKALLEHGCNVNLQDQSGDTPLHDAITVGNRDVILALANCPRFDFSLMNDRGFNVLQLAAFKGDSFALEQLVRQAQHLVNGQKGDGFTALHIACINGHRGAADVLISKGNASTELKNKERHTPLMIALSRAKVSTMELLIMKGANPNACDGDGETCLHWIVKLITSLQMGGPHRRESPVVDLFDAPEIASIVTQLPPGIREPTWVGVALFLVQHGADMYQQNSSGISPIQLLHDQKVTDILLQAQQRSQRHVNPQRKDPVIPRQLNSVNPKMTSNHGSNNPSSSVSHGNPPALRLIRPASVPLVRPNNPTSVRPNNQAPVRPNNQVPVRPNNQTLIRPNNQAPVRPNNTTLLHPNNPASSLSSSHPSSANSGCNPQQDGARRAASVANEAECVMCSEARVETIFRPCGHAIACQSCSLRMKKCPKCRTVISEKILAQN